MIASSARAHDNNSDDKRRKKESNFLTACYLCIYRCVALALSSSWCYRRGVLGLRACQRMKTGEETAMQFISRENNSNFIARVFMERATRQKATVFLPKNAISSFRAVRYVQRWALLCARMVI